MDQHFKNFHAQLDRDVESLRQHLWDTLVRAVKATLLRQERLATWAEGPLTGAPLHYMPTVVVPDRKVPLLHPDRGILYGRLNDPDPANPYWGMSPLGGV